MAEYHKPINQYFYKINCTGNQSMVMNAYSGLANNMDSQLRAGPEKSVALRKLLESFDAAMRSAE